MYHAPPSPKTPRHQSQSATSDDHHDPDDDEEEEDEETSGTSTTTSTSSSPLHDDAHDAGEVASDEEIDLDLDLDNLSVAFRRIMLPDDYSTTSPDDDDGGDSESNSSLPSSSSGFTGGGVEERRTATPNLVVDDGGGGGRGGSGSGSRSGGLNTADRFRDRKTNGTAVAGGSSGGGDDDDDDNGEGGEIEIEDEDEESVSEMYERMMKTFEDSSNSNDDEKDSSNDDDGDEWVDAAGDDSADGDDGGLSGSAEEEDAKASAATASMPPPPEDGYGYGDGGLGVFGLGGASASRDDYVVSSAEEVPLPPTAMTADLNHGTGGGPCDVPPREEEEEGESMHHAHPHHHRRDVDASSDSVEEVGDGDGDGDGAIAGEGAGSAGGPLHRRLEDEFDRHTDVDAGSGSSGIGGTSTSTSSSSRSRKSSSRRHTAVRFHDHDDDDDGPLGEEELEVRHGERRLDGRHIPGGQDRLAPPKALLSPLLYNEDYDDGDGGGGWTPTPFEVEFAGAISGVAGMRIAAAAAEEDDNGNDGDGDDGGGGGSATVRKNWSGCKCLGTNSYSFLHDPPPAATDGVREDRLNRERPEVDTGVNILDGDDESTSSHRRRGLGRGRGRRHRPTPRNDHNHDGKKPSPCRPTTVRRDPWSDGGEADEIMEPSSSSASTAVDDGGALGNDAPGRTTRRRNTNTPRRQRYCGMRRGPSPPSGRVGGELRRRGQTVGGGVFPGRAGDVSPATTSSSPRRRKVVFGGFDDDRRRDTRVNVQALRVSTSFSPIRLGDEDDEDEDGGMSTSVREDGVDGDGEIPDDYFDELEGLLREFRSGEEGDYGDDGHSSSSSRPRPPPGGASFRLDDDRTHHPPWPPPRPTTEETADETDAVADDDASGPTGVRRSPFATAEDTTGDPLLDPVVAATKTTADHLSAITAARGRGSSSRRSLRSWDDDAAAATSSTSSPSPSPSPTLEIGHGKNYDDGAAGHDGDGEDTGEHYGGGVDDGPSTGIRAEGDGGEEEAAVERVQLWLARNRREEQRRHRDLEGEEGRPPPANDGRTDRRRRLGGPDPDDVGASAAPLRRSVSWGTTTAPAVPPADTVPSGAEAAVGSMPQFVSDGSSRATAAVTAPAPTRCAPSPFSDDTTSTREELGALVSSLGSKVGALTEELEWERERNRRLGAEMDELLKKGRRLHRDDKWEFFGTEEATRRDGVGGAIVERTGDGITAASHRNLPQSFAGEGLEEYIVPNGNIAPPDDSRAVDDEVTFISATRSGQLSEHRLEAEEVRRPEQSLAEESASASASRHARLREKLAAARHERDDDIESKSYQEVGRHEAIREGDEEELHAHQRLREALSKLTVAEQTVDGLKSVLSRKDEALEDLTSKLFSLEREAEERKATLSSREKESHALRSKLSAAERELQEHKSSLLEKGEEVCVMRTDLDSTRNDANETKLVADSYAREVKALTSNLAAAEALLSDRDAQVRELTANILSYEQSAMEHRLILSARDGEVRDLGAKVDVAQSEAARFKTLLSGKAKDVREIASKLVSKPQNGENARTSEEIDHLRERLSNIATELQQHTPHTEPHRSLEARVEPLENNDDRGTKNDDHSEKIPADTSNHKREVEIPGRIIQWAEQYLADEKGTEIKAATAKAENNRQSSEIDQINDRREDLTSSGGPTVKGRVVADYSHIPNTAEPCALQQPVSNLAEPTDDDSAHKLQVENAELQASLARVQEEYAAKLKELEGDRILEKEEAERAVAELVVELDRTDREHADCIRRLHDAERELENERGRMTKLRADLSIHAKHVVGLENAQKRGDCNGIEGSSNATTTGSNVTMSNGLHELQVPATKLSPKDDPMAGADRENQLLHERLWSTDKELTNARERIANLEADLRTTSQELKQKEVHLSDYARQVDETELKYSQCLEAMKNGEIRLSNKCKEADLLSSKLEEQIQVVAKVGSEKQQIQKMFESATKEIDQCRQDYQDEIAKCKVVARGLELDIASKDKLNNELHARVCQLESDRDGSMRRIDEMARLLRTNEEQAKQRQVETQLLNEQLAATQGELREVRAKAERVGTELTEARKKLTDTGESNSSEMEIIRGKADQFETMRAQLSETLSMCGNLQIEVIALEESLKAARTEHKQCKVDLDRTKMEHEKDRQTWSKQLTANKEEAKLAVSELCAEIESADLERTDYRERLQKTEVILQDERQRYSALESRLESLIPEVAEKRYQTDIDKLKAQLSEYERLVGSLKEQVSQLTERLEIAEIEKDRYHQDLSHMQKTCTNSERRPNATRESRDGKAKRALSDLMVPVLEAEVNKMRQHLSQKNDELCDKGREISKFAKEMDSLRHQYSNNLKELQKTKIAMESCTSELASKCTEASDLAARLSAAQNNEARLSEENQRLGTTLEAAIKEVGQCRQSLSESHQHISDLEVKKAEDDEIRSRLQQIESELQEARNKEHILVTEAKSLRRRNGNLGPKRTSLSAEVLESTQADDDGKQRPSDDLYTRLLVTHNALLQEYSEAQEKVLFLEEELRQERSLHRRSIDRMELDAAELVNADETAEAEAQRADEAEAKLKESRADLQMARDELSRVLAAKSAVEQEYEKAISSMMSYSLGTSTHVDGLADISMVSTAVPTESSHSEEAIEFMRLLTAVVSLDANVDDDEHSAVVTQAWKSLGRMSSICKAFNTDTGDSRGRGGAPKTPPPTQFVPNEHGAVPKECNAIDGDVEDSVLHPSRSSIFSFLNNDARGQYQNVADGNHSCTSSCDSEIGSDLDVDDDITKLVSEMESRLDEALNDVNSNDTLVTVGAEVLLTPVGKKQFPYTYDEKEHTSYQKDDELQILSLRCQEAQQERDVALNERDELLAETLDLIEVTKQEQLAAAEANMASLRNDASRSLAAAEKRFYLMKSFLTWKLRVCQQQKTCRGCCNGDID